MNRETIQFDPFRRSPLPLQGGLHAGRRRDERSGSEVHRGVRREDREAEADPASKEGMTCAEAGPPTVEVEGANMDMQPLRERLRQWTVDQRQKAAGRQQEAKWTTFRLMLLLALVAVLFALLRILALWLFRT